MLSGVLRFELRAHAGKLTFLVAASFFGFLGFVTAASGFGPEDVNLNGPYAIANAMGLLSLGTAFSLTLFCAQSVLRDDEHQMTEIVYSTAVTKRDLLFGRFLGSFLAAVLAFAAAPVGMALGALAARDAARIGPFALVNYAWPFAVLALPSMFFVGALLFAVAALTRSSLATYVAGVALYVLYLAGALASDSPLMAGTSPTADGLARAALLDPFGMSAFFAQTQFLTPAERNVNLLALEGSFLGNRLLVLLIGALALALAYRFFRLALPAGSSRRVVVTPEASTPRTTSYQRASTETGAAAWLRALASRTALEIRMSLAGWPFLALLVLFAGSMSIEMWQSFRTNEYGTALLPTTSLVLDRLQGTLLPFGILVIVYWSAELVWRDRAVSVHEIVDATPSPNGLFLASKLLTLSALVVALTLAGVLTGIAFQVALGPVSIEAPLYLSLLVFTGIPLVLLAALAVFLQTLAPNRYVGMLGMVLVTIFWHRGSLGGFRHPLLRFAWAPEVGHSDLSGFSPLAGTFGWLMLFGALLAGLMTILATGLWRRGTEGRLFARLRAFPRSSWLAFGAVGIVWLALTGFLYRQSNVVNAYESREETLAWRAAYERAYRHLEAAPRLLVAAQSVTVDLYPEEGRARARGTLRLENRTATGIDSIWIATRRDLRSVALSVDGRKPAEADARFAMHRFSLSSPLAPGASTELAFDALLERRGLAADGDALEEIVPNGSFLLGSRFLPTVGFRFTTMIRDARERQRQGLPELTGPDLADDGELVHDVAPKILLETVVSTSPGETAVASGALSASWTENGRPHFRYTTTHPVSPDLGIASARWIAVKRSVRGVEVSVLYHADHDANVEAILSAACRTVDYGIRNFGPYPLPELRIVEIPSTWRQFGGLAMPGLIFLVESRAFVTDRRDPSRVDIVSKRVAHEVAHQWWGREVAPPIGPGAAVMVESLARYTELMILKEMHGREAIEPPLSSELQRYLQGRAGDVEVPLAQATNQAYLYYAKGALVFTALEDLIGEEQLNRGLHAFFGKASAPGAAPRIADLLTCLRDVTPVDGHRLFDEWFTETALYDLRVTRATSTQLPDGRYQVTASLQADRTSVGAGGKEISGSLRDPIEIEILGEGEGRVLHSEKRLIAGPYELSVIVTGRPSEIILDPRLRRIDRNRVDNRRKVEGDGR